jgi:hypothetical protein
LFSQKEFFLGFAVDDEMLIAQKTEKINQIFMMNFNLFLQQQAI